MLCLLFTAQVALAAGKRKAAARPKKSAVVTATPVAAPAPPSWSPEELERRRIVREFVVVGVYRPVEMVGRVVTVPREIYLQATRGSEGSLNDMVGQTLDVRRRVPVPAAVETAVASTQRTTVVKPAPKAVPSTPVSAPAPASSPPREAPVAAAPASGPSGAVARLKALKKAQEQARAAASAPASSAVPAPSTPAPAAEPPASPPSPASDAADGLGAPSREIVRPRPTPLPSPSMDVLVGRVQVVEIRGDVVVARVALDGLAASPNPAGFVPAEVPAVMAGDLARFVKDPPPPEAPPPPPPPQALSKAEKARLLAERKKAQSENWRRKNPRGKYERKSMKWKL